MIPLLSQSRLRSNIWGKVFRRLFLWTAISLALQLSFLFYINYILSPGHAALSLSSEELKLPSDASHISISFDGSLVSYCTSRDIEVVSRKGGHSLSYIPLNGDGVSFIRWLPDRSKMIYAVYKDYPKETLVGLYVYDADSKNFKNIQRLVYREQGCRINKVDFSTLTNLIYFQVEQARGPSLVYKIDILSKLSQVSTEGLGKIEQIALLPGLDTLIAQSKTSGGIYSIKGRRPSRIIRENDLYLLGVDSGNRIYLGKGTNKGITSIYQSDLHGGMNLVQSLAQPVPLADVTIGSSGTVCLANYPRSGSLTQTGPDHKTTTVRLNGPVQVCDDFVLTKKSGTFSIIPLPQV